MIPLLKQWYQRRVLEVEKFNVGDIEEIDGRYYLCQYATPDTYITALKSLFPQKNFLGITKDEYGIEVCSTIETIDKSLINTIIENGNNNYPFKLKGVDLNDFHNKEEYIEKLRPGSNASYIDVFEIEDFKTIREKIWVS